MGLQSKLSENMKHLQGFKPEVDIVGDMAYKQGYMTNSFFAIGHFLSDGHTIDYLYHLLSYVIPGQEPVMASCLSITDETTGQYVQDCQLYPFSQMEIATDRFFLKSPTGVMVGDIDRFTLSAQMPGGALQLELMPIGYPLLNGGSAKFHMVGMDIYEYSLPTCKTLGTITIGEKEYQIDGMSWYDRQWQRRMPTIPEGVNRAIGKVMEHLPKPEMAFPVWGWMDINMENGDFLSAWFAVEESGENCWGTVMHPDGSQRMVKLNPVIAQAGEPWGSPDSGAVYPTLYHIQSPEINVDLTVRCHPQCQELYFPGQPMYNHYEGASQVEGMWLGQPMKGYCYTELIGNWEQK